MNELKKRNRLGVFAFGDAQGIVDEYVLYLLEDMAKVLSDLVIVSYTKLTDEGYRKFEKYSNRIICVNDAECDVAACGKAIMEHITLDGLTQYDELVLFNDSFYGPIWSFTQVVEEMEQKNVDFWGITLCDERLEVLINQREVYKTKYIQRYFMVFNKQLVASDTFSEGWKLVLSKETAQEQIDQYEEYFTEKLEAAGYQWDTYIHLDELKSKKENMVSYDEHMPDYMLIEKKSPVLLKEIFAESYEERINYAGGEALARCMQYIENQTTYDSDMIWNNLLRLYNVTDLKQNLHLNYVLPNHCVKKKPEGNASVAVVIHSYYVDLLDDIYHYAKQVPEYVDLYITTGSIEKKKAIEEKFVQLNCKKFEVVLTENRGRDLAALLVASREIVKKYDYVCFTHDKKTSGNAGPVTVGRSFFYTAIENVLSSKEYIENIIATFENNPRLGVVSPPGPLHSVYFGSLGREWTVCYEETKKILDEFGVEVNISPDKQPFVLGTSLWFRTDALKTLLEKDWCHEDFPDEPLGSDGTISHGLERAFPYFAQGRGYYSGWVMTEEYASLEIANLRYLLSNVIDVQQKKREPYIEYYFKDYMALQKMKKYEIGTIYYNFGEGYDEHWKTTLRYEVDDEGKFKLSVEIPEEYRDKLKEFRFDPAEGKNCIVILEHVKVDGKALVINRHNGVPINERCQCFEDIDPYYTFCVDNTEASQIDIEGKLDIVSREVLVNILENYDIVSPGLYWDDGSGFDEGKCLRQKITLQQDGKFKAVYRLRDVEDIKSIRFDPLEGRISKVCIEKIICNGESVHKYKHNGQACGNGQVFFDTDDPCYIIKKSFAQLDSVEVIGTIYIMPDSFEKSISNKSSYKNKIKKLARRVIKR